MHKTKHRYPRWPLIFSVGMAVLIASVSFAQNQEVVDPNSPRHIQAERYYQDGVKEYLRRNYQAAASNWMQAITLEPTHSRAQLYFERAYERYTYILTNYLVALEYFDRKEYQECIPRLKSVLTVNPRHKDALFYLNLCYLNIGIELHIMTTPDGKGEDIDECEITADQSLRLYSVGYNYHGEYISEVEAYWSTSGTLSPFETHYPVSSIDYIPRAAPASGVIFAEASNTDYAETGTITVTEGSVAFIRVITDAENTESVVADYHMTTDDTLTVYAAGFDSFSNFIGIVPVEWETTGGLETIEPESGTSFAFMPTKARTEGYISATTYNGISVVEGPIYVTPGALAYLRIENAPDGAGHEVYEGAIGPDDVLQLFAAGYDADDNFIDDITCNWNSDNLVKPIRGIGTNILHYTDIKGRSGTVFIINASVDDETVRPDATGEITILKATAATVSVMMRHNGEYSDISNLILTTDDSVTFCAVLKNETGEFVEVPARWFSTGTLGITNHNLAVSFTFEPRQYNISGTILIYTDEYGEASSGKISVIAGRLHHLALTRQQGSEAETVTRTSLNGKESIRLYAAGYTKDDLFIGNYDVSWSVNGRTVTAEPSASYTYTAPDRATEEIIRASYEGVTGECTIGIIPLPATIAYVTMVEVSNKVGSKPVTIAPFEELSFTLLAYDRDDVLMGTVAGRWSGSGTLIVPAAGLSETLHFVVTNVTQDGRIICRSTNGMEASSGAIHVDQIRDYPPLVADARAVYIIKTGDWMSRILWRIYKSRIPWPVMVKYCKTLAEPSHIENIHLIYPGNEIYMPAITAQETMTKQEFVDAYIRDKSMVDRIIIWEKEGDLIEIGDLILIDDLHFLATGTYLQNEPEE